MATDAAGLYWVLDAVYEKRCVAISSTSTLQASTNSIPITLATTSDGLLRHGHVCQTNGDSICLTQFSPEKD